ncbi:hypothetical protein R1flu_011859 [Riccia fluitans]|uniref:Uncharacterized protein n=1 Tax=Riccia fluitans TaxID=41844 RepID=A0ABD1ZCA2_9MARC
MRCSAAARVGDFLSDSALYRGGLRPTAAHFIRRLHRHPLRIKIALDLLETRNGLILQSDQNRPKEAKEATD